MAVLLLWSGGPKEPSYNGRSLSSWLEEWGKSYNDRTNHATIAIRAIGSNGLPILVADLSKEESPHKRKFWRIAGKVVPKEWNPIDRDINRSVTAAEAINLLGVEAKTAFPTLTNLFSSRLHCLPAAMGLAGIGHEGVAVLLQALTNQDWVHRHSAATALGEARSDLDRVVPALLQIVKIGGHKEEDSLLRGAAGSALVRVHKEPDLVVPVFSEFLTNADANTRVWGASLLYGFGADAKAAVPLLLKARNDANSDVRETVGAALKEIDPKAAADAGLK
jgi:HEAT repeat protein